MSLFVKIIRRTRRYSELGVKYLLRYISSGNRSDTTPVFLCGLQRSGSNMVLRVLGRSPECWIFNEDHPKAFRNCRIKPFPIRQRLIEKSPFKIVVFKTLIDSINLDRILAEHHNAKVIWLFRNYSDVANSHVRKWGGHSRWAFKQLATDTDWEHRFVERLSDEVRRSVASFYNPDVSNHDGAAIRWYVQHTYFYRYGLDKMSDRVMLVKYEDMVLEPLEKFKILYDFLGLKFNPKYVDFVFNTSIKKDLPAELNPEVKRVCDEMFDRLLNSYQTQKEAN